jgi:hypothetical protein
MSLIAPAWSVDFDGLGIAANLDPSGDQDSQSKVVESREAPEYRTDTGTLNWANDLSRSGLA